MQMTESKRRRNEHLASALKLERASFDSTMRELSENILPRRLRQTISDVNKGDKRYGKIIDSTPTFAARTLASGMMAGVTSPAREWFKLTTPDPELAENGEVKNWLNTVSKRMNSVFYRSNLYNALPTFYADLGTFATSAIYVEEDFDGDVVRFTPFAVGSYWISNNDKLKVDTFYREFRMTVRQVVEKFGKRTAPGQFDLSNMSVAVQTSWREGRHEDPVDICHLINPNPEFNPKRLEAKYKRYASSYWEKGSEAGTAGADDNKFLRESGYDRFPVLVARWQVTGEDSYGTDCPGMVVLGGVKALQLMHKRKAQAVEKMINPPMSAPSSLKTSKVSTVAGDVTYVDVMQGGQGFQPVHEVRIDISHLKADISEERLLVQRAYYEDLFLMLANSDRRQITAREIDERHEEKLLALGPVLEQLNQDALNPLIDLTYDIMDAQGLIPPAPEALQGKPLKVEFVSIMAEAQKLVGLSGMDRLKATLIELAPIDPSVLKKVNLDQYIDEYSNILSTPPGIIRTDEEVAAIRQVEAQAIQAQQQAEQMAQQAKAAKDLSGADMGGDNALTRMADMAQAGQLAPQ